MAPFAYVANPGAGTVEIIDTATNGLVTRIQVHAPIAAGPVGSPFGVAIGPDGKRAYVAHDFGAVAVLDTATNTMVATVPVEGVPAGIAITPDGKRAYVTNESGGGLVIDTATNTVVSEFAGVATRSPLPQMANVPM